MKKVLYVLLSFCFAGSVNGLFAETLTWQDCIDMANTVLQGRVTGTRETIGVQV